MKTATAPRKRPKQDRSLATVDALLTATARVLVKEGYDRASTNRIAEAAGVSIGSLYQYFPSKEALVAALMDRHQEDMSALIASSLARVMREPIRKAVREMVEMMICAHALDPKLHRVLMEEVPRTSQLKHAKQVEQQAMVVARAYLEARRSELRVSNLDLASLVMVQTIEALTHGAVIHRPDLLETEELKKEIVDIVVRYLIDERRRGSV
jgi:AcrR family transcriptional regulator